MLSSISNHLLCLSVCCVVVVVDVRFGRPGVFLRHLCVPAERRDDEPVLHLRCLPQVTPLLPIQDKKMNFSWFISSFSSQLSENSFVISLLSNMDLKHQIEADLSESVVCSLPLLFFPFVLFSGSRLGGVITTMCFFFNHGEVSALPLLSGCIPNRLLYQQSNQPTSLTVSHNAKHLTSAVKSHYCDKTAVNRQIVVNH